MTSLTITQGKKQLSDLSQKEQVILSTILRLFKDNNTNILNLSYKHFLNHINDLLKINLNKDEYIELLENILKTHGVIVYSKNSKAFFNFFSAIYIDTKQDCIKIKTTDFLYEKIISKENKYLQQFIDKENNTK